MDKDTTNIDQKIIKFINDIEKDVRIPTCVHNDFGNFIPGTTPIYYSGPYWDDLEILAAIKILILGDWISAGKNVQEFEIQFAKVIDEKYGIMTNSGSSANLVMLASLKKYYNWNDNDEIIVSPVGFPTTISSIVQNSLKPIFLDIEMETLNFDLNLIECKITNKTRAIFLSPVLGNPPNIDQIKEICMEYDLKLILDDCDSLGSKWDGKFLNKYCVASSHSFYAAHTISTGEGGMIVTSNNEIAKIARSLINWGRECHCYGSEGLLPNGVCNHRFSNWLKNYDGIIDHRYVFSNIGYNLKPLDLQGGIGNVQLTKLEEIYTKRNISKERISKIFEKIDGIHFPVQLDKADTIWFGTPIICKNKELKQKLVTFLEKNKVQTRNYFAGDLLLHRGYESLGNFKDYPNANLVLDLVFFVGASPHYNEKIFEYFESVMRDFKNE